MPTAKPFIKWVRGKGQLISQLDELLLHDFRKWDDVTNIEPFIGSGAMLFHLHSNSPNINNPMPDSYTTAHITCKAPSK